MDTSRPAVSPFVFILHVLALHRFREGRLLTHYSLRPIQTETLEFQGNVRNSIKPVRL